MSGEHGRVESDLDPTGRNSRRGLWRASHNGEEIEATGVARGDEGQSSSLVFQNRPASHNDQSISLHRIYCTEAALEINGHARNTTQS